MQNKSYNIKITKKSASIKNKNNKRYKGAAMFNYDSSYIEDIDDEDLVKLKPNFIKKLSQPRHKKYKDNKNMLRQTNLKLVSSLQRLNKDIIDKLKLFQLSPLCKDNFYALNNADFNLIHKIPCFIIQTVNPYNYIKSNFCCNSEILKSLLVISLNPLNLKEPIFYQLNLHFNKHSSKNIFSYSWYLIDNEKGYIALEREDSQKAVHQNLYGNLQSGIHRHIPSYEYVISDHPIKKYNELLLHAPAEFYTFISGNRKEKIKLRTDYELALQNFFDSMGIYTLIEDPSLPNRIYKINNYPFVETFEDRYDLSKNIYNRDYMALHIKDKKIEQQSDLLNFVHMLTKQIGNNPIKDFKTSCLNLQNYEIKKQLLKEQKQYKNIPVLV